MKPPAIEKPLSSEELERDAEEAGFRPGQTTGATGDTHLPASESEVLADQEELRPAPIERALTQLPPG